jgi:hypothetical protein
VTDGTGASDYQGFVDERMQVLPSHLCGGSCGTGDYQPLNDCFIATLHSCLASDGIGQWSGYQFFVTERIETLPSHLHGGETSDYQPLTWPFIGTLPSRLRSNGDDRPSGYQALTVERIETLLSRSCGDCGGVLSGYQPLRKRFIEVLPSSLRGDGIDGQSGYQAFRPRRIATLPSRVRDDGIDEPRGYQAFRLESIGASLRGLGVHGRDDRAQG